MRQDPTGDGRVVFIRYQNQRARKCNLVIHNNCADRMALRRRQFIQISALSAFDGSALDYRGFDG